MTCPICGTVPATHKVETWTPSNVGIALTIRRGCTRCIETLAKSLLVNQTRVEVKPL